MDLQLDPTGELAVSRRHAIVEHLAGYWTVRDLGSRNGTFVNGERAYSGTRLHHGDRIQLGSDGPVLQFLHGDGDAFEHLLPDPAPAATVSPATAVGLDTGEVRARVARATRPLQWVIAGLAVLVVGLAGMWVYSLRANRAQWEADAQAMRLQIDSILAESGRTTAELASRADGLAESLARTEEELRDVQRRLSEGARTNDRDEVEELRRALLEAQTALTRQQLAASVDYAAIEEGNRRAVAKLFVEFGPGETFTGSAFAVRATGVLATSRHLVRRGDGQVASRIGVQFSDSRQVYPARVVEEATTSDLALLQVERLAGRVPVVRALDPGSPGLEPGSAVALIGFPLGGAPGTREGQRAPAQPIVSAGVVRGRVDGELEVDGYGAEGASGSPFFDESGAVIGVLYGGRDEGAHRVLLGVTVDRLVSLLGGR